MKIYDWKRFLTFIAIVILLIATILYGCSRKTPELIGTEEYEVETGDTIYWISQSYVPKGMTIQEYIYNLQEYNGIGSLIYPNQKIQMLIYKEA